MICDCFVPVGRIEVLSRGSMVFSVCTRVHFGLVVSMKRRVGFHWRWGLISYIGSGGTRLDCLVSGLFSTFHLSPVASSTSFCRPPRYSDSHFSHSSLIIITTTHHHHHHHQNFTDFALLFPIHPVQVIGYDINNPNIEDPLVTAFQPGLPFVLQQAAVIAFQVLPVFGGRLTQHASAQEINVWVERVN